MNCSTRENNPFTDFGEYVQSVEIQQPLRQTENTYFINFDVTRKNPGGYTIYSEQYTNIDFYESVPESNPLGIYITNFDCRARIFCIKKILDKKQIIVEN